MECLVMRRESLENLPDLPALPAGFRLRELLPEELPALADLMRDAFEDPVWSVAHAHREFVATPHIVKTLVIVDSEGDFAASATVLLEPEANPGRGVVHYVATHPKHQGRRFGALVTLAVLHEFAALGCRGALLRTEDHRLPAIQTYLNLGFAPVIPSPALQDRWEKIFAQLAAHKTHAKHKETTA